MRECRHPSRSVCASAQPGPSEGAENHPAACEAAHNLAYGRSAPGLACLAPTRLFRKRSSPSGSFHLPRTQAAPNGTLHFLSFPCAFSWMKAKPWKRDLSTIIVQFSYRRSKREGPLSMAENHSDHSTKNYPLRALCLVLVFSIFGAFPALANEPVKHVCKVKNPRYEVRIVGKDGDLIEVHDRIRKNTF